MTQVLGMANAARQMEAALHHHVDHLPPSPPDAAQFRKRATTLGSAMDVLQKQDGPRELICLCTPAPKIPRPRNAFILYRQHHQAQVTADNPKLSNPDISKIIGDKWKKESDGVKQNWKRLAEEEKQRHQNQYPNYRYQPRRGNKPTTTSPTEDQGRCPRCHGRPMMASTPQTPSTPYVSSPATAVTPQRLDTTPLSRRSSMDHSPTSLLPFSSKLPPVRDSEPVSPGTKRRRADGAGGYHPVSRYSDLPLADGLPPNPVLSFARTPSNTLPELGNLARSQSGPMPPPPPTAASLRPHSASAPWLAEKDRRQSYFDESLRLPPLQTPSPARSQAMDARPPVSCLALSSPRDQALASPRDQAPPGRQTLEDMVMAISFQRKVSLLASICPPAPPLRMGEATRGAFIAVEGPDMTLRRGAGNAIEKGLMACGEVQLKVWHDQGRDDMPNATGSTTTPTTATITPSTPTEGGLDTSSTTRFGDVFEPYFNIMASWQKRAKQIGRHITGTKPPADEGVEEQRADGQRVTPNAAAADEANNIPSSSTEPTIPVALAKEGFSLTIADRYACAMPIPDRYGAAEHWQWMATLWRGTLCPDLIVYVMAGGDGYERRTVELSRRMGLIVVKVPAGQGLDEATERRLAFEVMEWMREGSFREPLPRDWRWHMP
ncbi:hypothetical protein CP532_1245 [Ophiocordyceps camponoti-leonardi (nom. inval.)]|nr:hypothetical protein CP532_1245 [Ophiocordyceps camponoti-leonardi (nom. inval.)]